MPSKTNIFFIQSSCFLLIANSILDRKRCALSALLMFSVLFTGLLSAQDRSSNAINSNFVPKDTREFQRYLPTNAELLDVFTGIRNGLEFHSIKYLTENGEISSVLVNPSDQIIQKGTLPPLPIQQIGDSLKKAFEGSLDVNEVFNVSILVIDNLERPKPAQVILTSDVADGEPRYTLNGVDVTEDDIALADKSYLEQLEMFSRDQSNFQKETLESSLRSTVIRENLVDLNSPENNAFTATLTRSQIEALLNEIGVGHVHVDLKDEDVLDINDAVQWSGINDHARFGTHQGANIGVWQNEGSCAPNNWAPVGNITTPYTGPASATFPITHAEDMAMIIRTVSPLALIQCVLTVNLPTTSQANNSSPNIEVSTRSLTNSTSTGNYHQLDAIADTSISNSLVPHVNSAGNFSTTDQTPNVRVRARGLNVLTIGNANIDTTPASRATSSKWFNSSLLNEKPEISAPGIGTNLPTLGRSTGGTSAATAHTAGFIANLIDHDASLSRRPMAVKALLMAGATTAVSGGRDQVGLGGINYRDTSQFYNLRHFRSSNHPTQLTFNVPLDVSKPKVRAVLTWLNSGLYALTFGSMSVDYDLRVLSPSNVVVASSASHVEPFEDVDFTVNQSGTYKFIVTLFALQNPGWNSEIGLAINSDD